CSGGHLAEFFDVGSGNESAACSDDNCSFDCGVSIYFIDCRPDGLRHARTEGVHRRVVDGDDGDIILSSAFHELVHRAIPDISFATPSSKPSPWRSSASSRKIQSTADTCNGPDERGRTRSIPLRSACILVWVLLLPSAPHPISDPPRGSLRLRKLRGARPTPFRRRAKRCFHRRSR